MNLQKTTFYLFTLISLVLTSCSSDDENKNDTQVLVTVISADDKPLSNEIVQMFDEKTYEEFKKDNRTTPTAYALTNSKGVATFLLMMSGSSQVKTDSLLSPFNMAVVRRTMKYGLRDVPYVRAQLHK